MRKLLIIAVLALCLTALVGVGAVGSGGANSAGVAAPKTTYVYQMVASGYVDGATPDPLFWYWGPGNIDVHVIINMGARLGTWAMEIEDSCLKGDTMLAIKLGFGGVAYDVATSTGTDGCEYPSPTFIELGPVSGVPQYGWILVITGYIPPSRGVFPANYYYRIWM